MVNSGAKMPGEVQKYSCDLSRCLKVPFAAGPISRRHMLRRQPNEGARAQSWVALCERSQERKQKEVRSHELIVSVENAQTQ